MSSTTVMLKAVPVHETFRTGALLAVVGGFLDAYTYLLRGGVFANAQTGNIVLLAVNAAEGNWKKAVYYVAPILAFAAGVFMTEWLKKKFTVSGFVMWEHWIILIEVLLLFVVGLIPESVPNSIVNVTVSFICSIQVNSFRKVRNISYASTMCTGNLRSGTESLFCYLAEKDEKAGENAGHYFGIIAFFIAGAAVGSVLVHGMGVRSVWFCCAVLLGVFCIMTFAKGNENAGSSQ